MTLEPSGEDGFSPEVKELIQVASAMLHERDRIVGNPMSSGDEVKVKGGFLMEEFMLSKLSEGRPTVRDYARLTLDPLFDVNKQRVMMWGADSDVKLKCDKTHLEGFGRLLTSNVRVLKEIWSAKKYLHVICQGFKKNGIAPPEEWSAVGDPGDFEPQDIVYYASWSTEDGRGTVLDDFNGSLFTVTSAHHGTIDEDGNLLISITKKVSESFKPEEWRGASELKSGIDKLPGPIFELQNPNCFSEQVGGVLLESDNLEHHYGTDPFDISDSYEAQLRLRACRRSTEAITFDHIIGYILRQNDDYWGGSPGD